MPLPAPWSELVGDKHSCCTHFHGPPQEDNRHLATYVFDSGLVAPGEMSEPAVIVSLSTFKGRRLMVACPAPADFEILSAKVRGEGQPLFGSAIEGGPPRMLASALAEFPRGIRVAWGIAIAADTMSLCVRNSGKTPGRFIAVLEGY